MENSFSGSNGSDEDSYYTTIDSAPPKRRAGRTKFRETRHPVYKGVRQRNTDRWVCEVREPNKKSRIWLGTFPTAEMAARAHDVAAIALRGRSACLNFADSAWLLPAPESSSPRAIQKAAAEAAEAFRPAGGQERGNESGGGPGNAMSSSTGIDNCSGQVDGAFYMDDGLSLGMQGYFDMAQGMLIDPPPMSMAMGDEEDEQEVGESSGEVSLWSYSI